MIEIRELSVAYGQKLALEAISCTITGPTITGIIGPNGAGKSTLLKGILGMITYQGTVWLEGQAIKKQVKRVAYVEQKSALDFTFPITVRECVSLGLYPSIGIGRRLTATHWEQVEQALLEVGLLDYQHRQIGELSGGQFQRVLVARCLVQQADYIFLDEPFVGIDSVSEQVVMELLRALKAQGKTILIVHHDLSKATQYFDQLLVLNRQLIAFGPTDTTFSPTVLKQAYGENIFVKEAHT